MPALKTLKTSVTHVLSVILNSVNNVRPPIVVPSVWILLKSLTMTHAHVPQVPLSMTPTAIPVMSTTASLAPTTTPAKNVTPLLKSTTEPALVQHSIPSTILNVSSVM